MKEKILNSLEISPVIAAVKDKNFTDALNCPCEIIFLLGGNILSVEKRIKSAHEKGKFIFVHIDLTDGISKDKYGVEFLSKCGADGIISTRTPIIKAAKELNLIAVQRFFVYDSQGVANIEEVLSSSASDIIEIMPGIMGKIIEKFSRFSTPLIVGGLIETKQEVTDALKLGACAVSTGKRELWYL